MSSVEANLEYAETTYDGKEKTPKVTIDGMTEGKDYTVSYSNNVNAGEAKVVITGIGELTQGTLTKTFKILPKDIVGNKIELAYNCLLYTSQ